MALQAAKVQEFIGHSQAIYCMCAAENSHYFYSCAGDGQIVRWNISTAQGELVAKLPSPIYSLFYYQNFIYAGTNHGNFYVLDSIHKKLIKEIPVNCGGIFSITYYKDEIVFGGENGSLFFYKNGIITQVKITNKSIRKILIKDNQFYLACSDFNIYLYSLENKTKLSLTGHQNSVFALTEYNDLLFSGGRDAQLFIWQNNQLKQQIAAHLLHIHDIQINNELNLLATCSMDKTIKLWNLETQELLKVIDLEKYDAHSSSVNKILWIDKNTLISCSDDRKMIQFNITQ